ncbi:MAG TPA: DUF4349 domain-containing protein [Pseudolysinimonas sp.]|nr:DUF4349 domain-containing protein [Pseudolysinimonas sp.]
MKRPLGVTSAVLATVLLLAGCAGGGGSHNSQGGDGTTGGGNVVGQPAAGPEADRNATVDRKIVISGDVTITTADPVDAAAQAARIVEAAGGRIDSRSETAPRDGDAGSAQLTLRIPADKLTPTLDKLRTLGRADSVALSSSDVTVQTQDLDARITALRASIGRLNGLVARAATVDDLIKLETEISTRQAELEGLEAQQRYLADQVDMSTVNLTLRSPEAAPSVVPGDFWSGLGAGWAAFGAFWAGVLVIFGVLLPWLVTAALVTFVVLFLVGRRRARRPAVSSPDESAQG